VENADQVDWTPDGTGLSYVCHVRGMSQIWVQPLNGEPRQITRFQSNKIYSYAWARNGKQLAMTRGASNVDAVLIKQQQ
jgi:Tol biopolymer transport system component